MDQKNNSDLTNHIQSTDAADFNYGGPNLGIIQELLQTLNEIFQNTKISTIIYSN